jgi:translation initiation factor 1
MSERKNRVNIVYSTNPDFSYEHDIENESDTLAPCQQKLKVSLDKKQRKGKIVTLVSGFIGKEVDLEQLGRFLKTKCGVGGSVKDNEIIIQGSFADKIILLLKNEGYKVVRV